MSSISVGQRIQKSEANANGYLTSNSIDSEEVCVLYLGGDGIQNDEDANGGAKIITNEILDTFNEPVAVYSVAYHFDNHKKSVARQLEFIKHQTEILTPRENISRIIAQASAEEYNPAYIDELFSKAVRSRLVDNKGQRLKTGDACRKIRKLNIVAHCHGAYVALKLEQKMQDLMQAVGYDLHERRKIQSQLLVVAHAPACPIGISQSQFISFRSVYDADVPVGNNFFNGYIRQRRQEEKLYLNAQKNHDAAGVKKYRRFNFKPCYFPLKQGNLFLIKQKYCWENADEPFFINAIEHNNVHYHVPNQTNDGKMMAHFARTILKNGIKNSLLQQQNFVPLPPLEKLILSEKPAIRAKEEKAFAGMLQNGKNFRALVCRVALNTRACQRYYGSRD